LAVTGTLEHEPIAELAFHRDGGRIPVMRGQPGAPVLIESLDARTAAKVHEMDIEHESP